MSNLHQGTSISRVTAGDSRVTAGEFMARLEKDPAYRARMADKERVWAEARADYLKVAAPVLADLADAGYPVEGISDLRQTRMRYPGAIPTLVHLVAADCRPASQGRHRSNAVGPVGEATGNAGPDRGVPGAACVR